MAPNILHLSKSARHKRQLVSRPGLQATVGRIYRTIIDDPGLATTAETENDVPPATETLQISRRGLTVPHFFAQPVKSITGCKFVSSTESSLACSAKGKGTEDVLDWHVCFCSQANHECILRKLPEIVSIVSPRSIAAGDRSILAGANSSKSAAIEMQPPRYRYMSSATSRRLNHANRPCLWEKIGILSPFHT